MEYGHGHGGYRGDPRMQSGRMQMPPVPITTITTGISLSDRFKVIQQSQVERSSFSDDGYGLPSSSRQNRLPGLRGISASRGVPKSVSIRNQQLALALAKRARATVQQVPTPRPLFRTRGRFRGGALPARPVQSRLGIKAIAISGRGIRRGASRVLTGRVPGLNRVQKTVGSIGRQSIRGSNQANRFGLGAPRGRGGVSRGLAGRSRGGITPGVNRGRGVARGNMRGGGRGGRGGNRRGGRGGGAAEGAAPNRDELDKELDSYMAHSKAYLDRQLDEYMLKAKAANAAITAGTVVVEDSDVSMADA